MKRNIDGLTRVERKQEKNGTKVSNSREDIVKSKKIKKLISKTKTNIEHLVPKSRGGTNSECNKKRSKIRSHSGKHDYLGVKLFHEQIIQILDDNKTTLHPIYGQQFIEETKELIIFYLENKSLYNPNCFKKGKVPKKI